MLEYGAVVWHSMLSDRNSRAIEWVQKAALSIILGPSYLSYENVLSQTGLKRLDERRVQLSLTFAKNTLKHPQHSRWFVKQPKNEHINTRSAKSIFLPVKARTQRLQKSPIAYLTQLLNESYRICMFFCFIASYLCFSASLHRIFVILLYCIFVLFNFASLLSCVCPKPLLLFISRFWKLSNAFYIYISATRTQEVDSTYYFQINNQENVCHL